MSTEPVRRRKLVGIYAISYLGGIVLLTFVIWAAQTWFGLSGESSSFGAVLPMLAAMPAGQAYASQTGAVAPKGYPWRIAAIFATVTLVIQAVLAALASQVEPLRSIIADMRADPNGTLILAILIAVSWLLAWVVSRFGFGLGVKQGLAATKRG